jgi:hypothetical protein
MARAGFKSPGSDRPYWSDASKYGRLACGLQYIRVKGKAGTHHNLIKCRIEVLQRKLSLLCNPHIFRNSIVQNGTMWRLADNLSIDSIATFLNRKMLWCILVHLHISIHPSSNIDGGLSPFTIATLYIYSPVIQLNGDNNSRKLQIDALRLACNTKWHAQLLVIFLLHVLRILPDILCTSSPSSCFSLQKTRVWR